jgi:plastocyanin
LAFEISLLQNDFSRTPVLNTKTKKGGEKMRTLVNHFLTTLFVTCLTLGFAPTVPCIFAQDQPHAFHMSANPPSLAQVVALDECDPTTFNAVLGPDFCKNIALGYSTTLTQLLQEAANGTPDPKWDFEPDTIHIHQGTILSVVDQGGEPHTFTEVRKFGGGFIPGLNGGEAPVPECAAGFSSVAVARTRILQGSQIEVTGLSQGEHHFQCCIHPWMRMTVDVK